MIAVTYRLELREPVLARIIDGDPNSGVSAPFIPGSMVRGAIATLMLAKPADGADLAAAQRPLLFDASVRYLNAYPAAGRRRTLPAPLTWQRAKDDVRALYELHDEAIYWLNQEQPPDDLKAVGGFVEALAVDELSRDGSDDQPVMQRYDVRRQIALHTLRSRKAGRATRDDGAVYQIDALAPGQHFAGAILVDDAARATYLSELLRGRTLYLGGAATAGYGRVEVVDVAVDNDWQETPGQPADVAAGQVVIVTALSDLLLRNDAGIAHTDLAAALALPVKLRFAAKGVEAVGAFNRKWGLPTEQGLAVRAGSVFVLEATAAIAAGTLSALVAAGIGERTVDGLGRIAINWQDEATDVFVCRNGTIESDRRLPVDLTASGSATVDLARRMATRRYMRTLDGALVEAILDQRLAIHRAPPNSQLARVRILVRRAMQQGDLAPITRLFAKGESQAFRDRARNYFEAARIANAQSLSAWVTQLAADPGTVWGWMPATGNVPTLGGIGPDERLAVQYAGRLIDGVLERAIKERNRNEQGGSHERAS